jgi:hypothetical protein
MPVVLASLATIALMACAGHRPGPGGGSAEPQVGDCRVFFFNKSASAATVSVSVDGEPVLQGTFAPGNPGTDWHEVALRLPLGTHRVRAVVGAETTEVEVHVTARQTCRCQVLYYEEPQRFGPTGYSRLVVEQIYPC